MKGFGAARGYAGQTHSYIIMKTQFVLLFMAACAGGGSQLFAMDVPPASADIVACKVIQTVKPVYPVRLMNDGITKGEARVVLQVDSTGQLTDTLVTAYTHKAFADEAVYAIQQWKFQPASVGGEPAGGIVEVTFDYAIDRMLIIQRFNNLQEEPSLEAGQYQYHTATLKQLDRIPTPTSIISPVYPEGVGPAGNKRQCHGGILYRRNGPYADAGHYRRRQPPAGGIGHSGGQPMAL